jgi:hypothetical protein
MKYPVQYRCEIDWDRGGAREREESKEERAARLNRNSASRRRRIYRKFEAQGEEDFIDGLSQALKLAICEGQPYPIHFNVRHVFRQAGKKDTTKTERYSLMDAVACNDLWTGEKTWNFWAKILKTRKSDEGIELAFPITEFVFHGTE